MIRLLALCLLFASPSIFSFEKDIDEDGIIREYYEKCEELENIAEKNCRHEQEIQANKHIQLLKTDKMAYQKYEKEQDRILNEELEDSLSLQLAAPQKL